MSKRNRVNIGGTLVDATTGEIFVPAPVHLASSRHYRSLIAQMEDRRRFAFDPFTPPVSVRRSDRRIVVRSSVVAGKSTFGGMKFSVPERVALCAKRKIRREIMFAFGRSGGGSRRKPFNRRNYWSQFGC